jgi:hypothetical protein
MLLIVFGALLVLCGIAHRYLVGIAQPAAFFRTGSRHSRALTSRHAIPRARSELAGYSTYGNRRSSVVVGGKFLATLVSAGPKHRARVCHRRTCLGSANTSPLIWLKIHPLSGRFACARAQVAETSAAGWSSSASARQNEEEQWLTLSTRKQCN